MYIVIIKSRCICVYHIQLFILEIQNYHDLQQLRYYVILDFHFNDHDIYYYRMVHED